jgi:hypothetical protein
MFQRLHKLNIAWHKRDCDSDIDTITVYKDNFIKILTGCTRLFTIVTAMFIVEFDDSRISITYITFTTTPFSFFSLVRELLVV